MLKARPGPLPGQDGEVRKAQAIRGRRGPTRLPIAARLTGVSVFPGDASGGQARDVSIPAEARPSSIFGSTERRRCRRARAWLARGPKATGSGASGWEPGRTLARQRLEAGCGDGRGSFSRVSGCGLHQNFQAAHVPRKIHNNNALPVCLDPGRRFINTDNAARKSMSRGAYTVMLILRYRRRREAPRCGLSPRIAVGYPLLRSSRRSPVRADRVTSLEVNGLTIAIGVTS